MLDAKQPDTGAFKLRLFSGEGWFVVKDGKDVAGPYTEQKTAARKARDLTAKGEQPEEPTAPEIDEGREAVKRRQRAAKGGAAKAAKARAETPSVVTEDAPLPVGTIKPVGGSLERHAWLEKAREECTRILRLHDADVPDKLRVSVGLPYGSRKAIGQCWYEAASADGYREVFVSPTLSDGPRICDVLLHEMAHASLPDGAKHGPAFKRLATACGLTGKMTATEAGEELAAHFKAFVEELGPYPAGAIDPGASGRKVQTTRLLKAACDTCGYTVRVTKKWLDVATPTCPDEDCSGHGEPMICD